MIYFVDEDFKKLRALISELVIRGRRTEVIRDADTAFNKLVTVRDDDVSLVLIDVMLAVKPENSMSRYDRKSTDEYHKTGLLLLDDLVQFNPDVFPRKAIYFTHASNKILLQEIEESANKYNVPVLRKMKFDTAFDFGNEIEKIIAGLK